MFRTDHRLPRSLLTALLFLFLGLLLAICLFPHITFYRQHLEQASMAVLIDQSLSMGLPYDRDQTRQGRAPSRLQHALDCLDRANETVLNPFRHNGGTVEYYGFAEQSEPLTDYHQARLNQLAPTNIYRSLRDAIKAKTARRIKNIIVVSDGGQTVADVLDRPAPGTSGTAVPVHVIPVLKDQPLRDLAITSVLYPDILFTNRDDTISVTISNTGFSRQTAVLRLIRDGQAAAERKIELTDAQHTIAFSITADQAGRHTWQVAIVPLAGELLTTNNRFDFTISSLKDKIRVICISGRPRWEYKFLRSLLKQDPKIELVSFVILREPDQTLPFQELELSLIQFPIREILFNNLPQFDLMVLDNFDYSRFIGMFPPQYLDQIEKFVQNGGGLLILGGSKSFNVNYRNTAIDRLSPLVIAAGGGDSYREQGFNIQVPARAYNHPILGGVSPAEWKSYPQLIDYNITDGAKPGAVVLAEHPSEKTPAGAPLPVIAVMESGKGRIMTVASGSTFRWNFIATGEGKANTHYYDFFHKAIRWLIRNPDLDPVRLNLAADRLKQFEPQKIDIYGLDDHYEPLPSARVTITITDPEGKRLTPGIKSSGQGRFSYALIPEKTGVYQVAVTVSSGDRLVKTLNHTFTVEPQNQELSLGIGNFALLRRISQTTGGILVENNDDLVLLKQAVLKDLETSRITVEHVVRWWHTTEVMVIGAGIILLHWLLRKRWVGR